jgi:hypothetical protein
MGLSTPQRQAFLGRLLALDDQAIPAVPRGGLDLVSALSLAGADDDAGPEMAALVERIASLAASAPPVPHERLAATVVIYLSTLSDLYLRAGLRTQTEMLAGLEVQPGDAPLQRAVEELAARHSADLQMLEQHAAYRLHS